MATRVSANHPRDPRRPTVVSDPLRSFGRNELCWCGSGRKYKVCCSRLPRSPIGAPLPDDPEDSYNIAPGVTLARGALRTDQPTVPIQTQFPRPQATQTPRSPTIQALISRLPGLTAMPYSDVGVQRYAALDAAGVIDANRVRDGQLDNVLERLAPDLLDASLDLAALTFIRALGDRRLDLPPVVLGTDSPNVAKLVGQTMFWADHYLIPDAVAALAVAGSDSLDSLRDAVVGLLEMRPLVEAGVAVPILRGLAAATVDALIMEMTNQDLRNEALVAWGEQQVHIDGPTAREVVFTYAIDDYPGRDGMYMYARPSSGPRLASDQSDVGMNNGTGSQLDLGSDEDAHSSVEARMLGRYEPGHDYGPWLATVRRQALGRWTRELNGDLAAAASLGADFITASPFRARLLRRRNAPGHRLGGAAWAQVPWLPDADPALLVKIANSEERVRELREMSARALRAVPVDDVGAQTGALTDVGEELSAAADRLGTVLRRSRAVDATAAGLAAGAVLVTGTVAPPLLAGAALAGLSTQPPGAVDRWRRRKTAAYAFWMARPR